MSKRLIKQGSLNSNKSNNNFSLQINLAQKSSYNLSIQVLVWVFGTERPLTHVNLSRYQDLKIGIYELRLF